MFFWKGPLNRLKAKLESTEYVGRAEDAIIALSNYRLHIKFKESLVNVSDYQLK